MGMIGNQPAAGLIGGGNIQDGDIQTADLANGAVTAAKLASTAVTDKLGYTPLNKAGDTLTGALVLKANQVITDGTTTLNNKGIDAQNSDIVGLNGLWFQDTADSASEGFHFVRTNGNWDTVKALDGVLYFVPNRTTNSLGSAIQILTASGGTVYGDFQLERDNPYIGFNNSSSDSGYECAVGVDGEDFVVFEPEDTGGTQVSRVGKEWFRIKDDEYAYIFGRRVWEAGTAPNAVLKVVQTYNNTRATYQNTNVGLMTLSIARQYASSKVLVSANWNWVSDNPNGAWWIQRSYDNSIWTNLIKIGGFDECFTPADTIVPTSGQFLDSPSSSYPTVYYRIFWEHIVQNGGTMVFNGTGTSSFNNGNGSTLTLMEIAA